METVEQWKQMKKLWKQWEILFYFILFGSKITEDGDCSHEIKRCLLLGRKAMTNLDIILKSRDRGCPVKAVVFPVVTYGCESWTLKTAEHRRIDAFELWCWRRLLRVPWTVWRSNQSILKEIIPEYSLEELMLMLQYFGHLGWRIKSLEKTLMREILKRKDEWWQSMRCLDGIIDSMDMNQSKLQEIMKDRRTWCAAVYGFTKSKMQLVNWKTTHDMTATEV